MESCAFPLGPPCIVPPPATPPMVTPSAIKAAKIAGLLPAQTWTERSRLYPSSDRRRSSQSPPSSLTLEGLLPTIPTFPSCRPCSLVFSSLDGICAGRAPPTSATSASRHQPGRAPDSHRPPHPTPAGERAGKSPAVG